MGTNWLKSKIESFVADDDYQKEKNKVLIAEKISQRLFELGISKIEFAKLLGTSPAYITKLLSGTSNFTLNTMYDISKVLDLNLEISFQGKKSRVESRITVKQDNVQNVSAIINKNIEGQVNLSASYHGARLFRTSETEIILLNQ